MAWFAFLSTTKAESQTQSSTVMTETTTIAVQVDSPATQQNSVVIGLSSSPQSPVTSASQSGKDEPKQDQMGRRFSFQSFGFKKQEKATPLGPIAQDKVPYSAAQVVQKQPKDDLSKSKKRAFQSALTVRSLIVGTTTQGPKISAGSAKPELLKVKSQLMEPKKANELLIQLRKLPAHEDPTRPVENGPIHAVCLSLPDEEEAALHFQKLADSIPSGGDVSTLFAVPGVVGVPLDKVAQVYKEMRIVDLITAPDLGLGQPGDGPGLLAGAVPTAEAVIRGFEQVTPQLMALGFATGKLVIPKHTGINPPVDRMSVLTYWWGLELLLPPPSLRYLSNAQSVTGAIMNFLSALALVNNGVREILPFIRYISQFIDFEFNAIRSQDKGNGVVCAATWIMPAAMIPRPWDFPVPENTGVANEETKLPPINSVNISSEPLPKLVKPSVQ